MRLGLIILGILLAQIAYSQIIEDENGLYYDENKNLYNGTYIEFHENGNKKIEMNIVEGLKEGKTFLYFSNGEINEIRSYKGGKMDGTWTTFNESKKKLAIANYKEDAKHGEWVIWDEKGTKRYQMYYENGSRTGKWLMWDENGKLVNEKIYEN